MATRVSRRTLGVLIVLLLVVALLALAVQVAGAQQTAQVDSSETVAPAGVTPALVVGGGPGHLMIHSSAFRPRVDSTVYDGGPVLTTISGGGYYDAPAYLPHGATVNQLTLYYMDNDAAQNITVSLYRQPLPGGTGYLVADLTTTGQNAAYTASVTAAIDPPAAQVDLAANAYYVRLNLPASANMHVSAVRIDYGYGAYLPLTVKP